MKIPEETLEQIRSQVDIVDVVGEYVDLKKAGNRYVGRCPFHEEKTASFSVSQDMGLYHCFGCKKSGNSFTFLKDYLGLSFNESVEFLAQRYGIHIPKVAEPTNATSKTDSAYKALGIAASFFNKSLKSPVGKNTLSYFYKREFSQDTIDKFTLGFSPDSFDATKNELFKQGITEETLVEAGLLVKKEDGRTYDRFRGRAMFAIKDFIGRVVGFGARQINDAPDQPKYINSPQSIVYDKSKVLYGIFEAKNAIRNSKSAIIVEGYADCITLHQAGINNVVASSGTALTADQLRLLLRYTQSLYLIFDSDTAGQKATDRGLEIAIELGFEVKIVRLPAGEDPDSMVRTHGKAVFESHLRSATDFMAYLAASFKSKGEMDTPAGKANAARYLVNIISKIPDKLQHDFYLTKLAGLLDLSESQLKIVYNEKNKIVKDRNFEASKEHYHEKPPVMPEPEESYVPPPSHNAEDYELSANFEELEKLLPEEIMIINLALKGPKFFRSIVEEFNVNLNIFVSELGRLIYSLIFDYYEQDNITENLVVDDSLDKRIVDMVIDIAFSDEKPSEKWRDFGADISEPDYKLIIKDAVLSLEIKQLDMELIEIQKILQTRLEEDNDNLLIRLVELTRKKDVLFQGISQRN